MKLSNIRLPLTLLLGVMPFLCGHATAEISRPTVTIKIDGQGDVWSMSGSRNCLLEGNETSQEEGNEPSQECEINKTAGTGDIYLAQARTGWRLNSWECPNNTPGEPWCEVPKGGEDVTIIATFEEENQNPINRAPPSDCAWTGPYVKQHDQHNVAYPDTGAAYWAFSYVIPEDAERIVLEGEFPHSRYMSFHSYQGTTPYDHITDFQIKPSDGSSNPFSSMFETNPASTFYQIHIEPGEHPDDPSSDQYRLTLYDGKDKGDRATIIYRNYVPDAVRDWTGDVGLPRVRLVLNNSQDVVGPDVCDANALDTGTQPLSSAPISPGLYENMQGQNHARSDPRFSKQFTFKYTLACDFDIYPRDWTDTGWECPNDEGDLNDDQHPEPDVGAYANKDNEYLYAFLNLDRNHNGQAESAGVIIRGTLPTTPTTMNRAKGNTDDESEPTEKTLFATDLRYWSICQTAYHSQKVEACLHDEDLALDQRQGDLNPQYEDRDFVIVSSKRPRVRAWADECNFDYLPWPENGDDFRKLQGGNDEYASYLLVRNMLPSDDFEHAIQDVKTPGTEADVLGKFLPEAKYFNRNALIDPTNGTPNCDIDSFFEN